ncbi:hypothetical protein FXO38_34336 [Capsicum annuum]|nr:hypothetical protein FXO37_35405 [Capsicum annuum]KAF3616762.1 hypothetical protein FXO38_34336 [Capsicum annuum]
MLPKIKETESGSTSDHSTKKARVQIDSEELPKQSHSGKNKVEESYEKGSGKGYKEADDPAELTGDLVLKCQLGKPFDDIRNIMKNENFDKLFKKSYFGCFLELPKDHTTHFQMSMVYGFLKRRINYNLTIKYLLTKLSPKTITFYVFPWAFMVKDYPNEVSYPRILRWLAGTSITRIKEANLFNPPDDAVVHPWIMPTEQELGMTSFITLSLVNTIADLMMELIKKELAGVTAIRRVVRQGRPNIEALHDQPTITDLGAFCGSVAGRVVDVGGSHPDADHNWKLPLWQQTF